MSGANFKGRADAVFKLDRFIEDCRTGLRERSPQVAIRDLLQRVVSTPSDLVGVLGTPREAGIATLHHSPELTVLNVVWAPGMAIYPHDHRMWAVIGLYGGREDNTFYRRGPAGLLVAGGQQLEERSAVLLGKTLIHSVANPLRAFTGAIHIYGGDFFGTARSEWDPDTREERAYDVERARRTFSDANERWRRECLEMSGRGS
jgi:predicted metal-dependent enzyme (double-stranded beta helix superfamily)